LCSYECQRYNTCLSRPLKIIFGRLSRVVRKQIDNKTRRCAPRTILRAKRNRVLFVIRNFCSWNHSGRSMTDHRTTVEKSVVTWSSVQRILSEHLGMRVMVRLPNLFKKCANFCPKTVRLLCLASPTPLFARPSPLWLFFTPSNEKRHEKKTFCQRCWSEEKNDGGAIGHHNGRIFKKMFRTIE